MNSASSTRFAAQFAVIHTDLQDPTLARAAGELRWLLEAVTGLTCVDLLPSTGEPHWAFTLAVDPALEPDAYGAAFHLEADARVAHAQLCGSDTGGVLRAVYATLEEVGVRFDILGPILPDRVDLNALLGRTLQVHPRVRRRGIRQHINFPMDISAYPLAEALEYVRNLARLQLTHLTLHSYTGQWFACALSTRQVQAGGFFYGQEHPVPDHPVVRPALRNRRTFCIPEFEALHERPTERSDAAIEWLNAVVDEARHCGLHVQFSLEPPGESLEDGLAACRAVLQQYPGVQTLELVTPECGGQGQDLDEQQTRDLLTELFGAEVAADATAGGVVQGHLGQLPGTVRQLARNLQLARALAADLQASGRRLVLGVYATCRPTLRLALALLRRCSPADAMWAFLPAHGGRAAVESIHQMGLTAADWQRLMVYSWAEFDGNMYIQQNCLAATSDMIQEGTNALGATPLAGLAVNHWRTAENRLAIRHAAQAMLAGPLDPAVTYRSYAAAMGLGARRRLVAALQRLDATDTLASQKLFNVGFCYYGCWVAPKGLGWISRWRLEDIQRVRAGYQAVQDGLAASRRATRTTAGRRFLRLLENRLECTDLHLQAIAELLALARALGDTEPAALTPAQRQQVEQHCSAATALTEAYMAHHARTIADRGGEGTLISYYVTIPAYIQHIREYYGCQSTAPGAATGSDAPPPPAQV